MLFYSILELLSIQFDTIESYTFQTKLITIQTFKTDLDSWSLGVKRSVNIIFRFTFLSFNISSSFFDALQCFTNARQNIIAIGFFKFGQLFETLTSNLLR